MVFQNNALDPHMTVARNMGFALRRAEVPAQKIRRKVTEAADLRGISGQIERKPSNLCGGQRQRVAMGRATVRDPQALLMDEPLSNLDAKLRIQMRAEIVRHHRQLHTTIVYVTHDQTGAMTLDDRLAFMRDGFLQQVVGVRPESFEDASPAGERPGLVALTATVDVLESTGSDVYAHLPLNGRATETADEPLLREIAHATASEDPEVALATGSELVARVGVATTLAEGKPGRLWVEATWIHLLDPATGRRLSG